MKTLEEIFKGNTGRIIHRHEHVLDIYDEYFSRFRGKEVNILEIGLDHGGSIFMWKEYFGEKAHIYGMDIAGHTVSVEKEDPSIKVFIGDQGNLKFLQSVISQVGGFDVIIDDGSHECPRQIACFEFLFSHMKDNGIYAIEDLHCSYRALYGGGYKKPGATIEYAKDFIDYLLSKELPDDVKTKIPRYLSSMYGIHFHRNVLLIDKYSQASSRAGDAIRTGKDIELEKPIRGGRLD